MKTLELKSLSAVIEALRDKVNVTLRTASGATQNVFLDYDDDHRPEAFIMLENGFASLRIHEKRFNKFGTFYANI